MPRRPVTETAKLIDVYAQAWLRLKDSSVAKPKDLMPYLVARGVFMRDHRAGLPLRRILRELDKLGKLCLIRGLRVKRSTTGYRRWFFDRVDDCG